MLPHSDGAGVSQAKAAARVCFCVSDSGAAGLGFVLFNTDHLRVLGASQLQ